LTASQYALDAGRNVCHIVPTVVQNWRRLLLFHAQHPLFAPLPGLQNPK
jgi:hypothetical protein